METVHIFGEKGRPQRSKFKNYASKWPYIAFRWIRFIFPYFRRTVKWVPVWVIIIPAFAILLTFKSPNFTLPFLNRNIFAHLISLCTMFFLCKASSPSRIYLKIYHILLSFTYDFIYLAWTILDSKSPESAYSITIHNFYSFSSKNASL